MRSALALTILAATTMAALGDSGPVIAVPSRPDVAVVINGRYASYAVVEGDWGLAKSVRVEPVIYPRDHAYGGAAPAGHYFPSEGRAPGYGRREIDTPPRALPRSESFSRSWSIESNPAAPTEIVPANPPPVIVAPQIGQRQHYGQPALPPAAPKRFHPQPE